MKHARKKPSHSEKRHLDKEIRKSYHKTEEDYRREYLFDDDLDGTRKIERAGYKPRRLDSYIPQDKLESKVKSRRETSGDTARIDTAAIAAAEEDMKHKRNSRPAKTASARGASKTQKKTKKQSSGKAKKFVGRTAAVFGVALFIAMIICIGIGAGMYSAVSKELEDLNVRNLAQNYSSFVYYNDREGNAHELVQLHYEGDRRVWVESSEISQHLKDAAVAIEDERFYKHNGVDLKRTAGATIGWALSKVGIGSASYGGSTLTQQLIKNITNEKDKKVTRKIKEMMRAVALENQIKNKDEILAMYLNVSYFANQCYGVEAAANLYFNKHASDLGIAESAMIAGITQRPGYFDPVKNPDNALTKRNTVLYKMNELGYITDEEYKTASDSPLGLSDNIKNARRTVYSYFVDQVINDVKADLISQKGYSDAYAEQQVFSGGLKIYITMDKDVQDAMESVFENRTGFPKNTKPQSAMIVMDQYTGEIKGIVGGAGKKTEARGLNRATQSRRQPGSSLKPISVYAPGIETGKINTGTVLRDEKITIGDWSPSNSYTGFKGDLILRRAIEISANIPAIKALQLLGVDNSYNYVSNHFGIKLVNEDKSLSPLSLGGLTNGVTVKEMAAAYAVFANGGIYTKPYTYTKVLDSAGRVLLENTPETKRAVSEATAFIMTDLLNDVINGSSGTGRAAKLANGMPAYGKTGTTNDNHDKWFVGFTKYYVGAVWYGFDTPSNLRSAGITNNPSCVIWKNVMDKIHKGLDTAEYTAPDSVKRVTICTKTGKLASSGCGYAKTDYFVSGNVPTKSCKLSHGGSVGESGGSRRSPSPSLGAGKKNDSDTDSNGGESNSGTPVSPSESRNDNPGGTHEVIPDTPVQPSGGAGNSQPSDGVISLD